MLDVGTSVRYYPTNHGNGNVSESINSNGSGAAMLAAHFEYDPFGNLTAGTSETAAAFPYRFSTKPQDPVTGLLYYGYRWYDPLTGRWPSRDPIWERGGVNLYAAIRNELVSRFDLLGLRVLAPVAPPPVPVPPNPCPNPGPDCPSPEIAPTGDPSLDRSIKIAIDESFFF